LRDPDDRCPRDPEDRDRFEDTDGCPDPDNDADRVFDASDKCPDEAEDLDEFDDVDGCPEPDNDLDGVLDTDDRCPVVPGPESEHGCPGRVRVEKGMIVILERVEFAVNQDVILDTSLELLGEVRDTIAANPQMKLIRVEGHTDDRGKDAYNLDLSSRRARSVARWLRDHDVDEDRLEAYGCGKTNPSESNDSESGRQANRRVEFHIIDPPPDAGPRSAVYCEPIAL
jgi:outer membrane protein OmpA-like peptidoglycan-associated protein